MQKIGVLGACDTAGVVATLRSIVPETTHVAPILRTTNVSELRREDKVSDLLAAMQGYDKVFVSTAHAASIGSQPDAPITFYPPLVFDAFHPDIIYMRPGPNKDFIPPHYHSAIVVWCYLNKVPPQIVPSLFSARNFDRLGYFDRWADALTLQRQQFERTEVEFNPYMLHMSRHLPFMHSINHPKMLAIATMARLLARSLGLRPNLDAPVYTPDGLAGAYWPIYPEIGERLGLRGAYDWTREQRRLNLLEYVEHCYAQYDNLGLDPAAVIRTGNNKQLDSVLGADT
jgi:hypothetical protein